MTDNFVSVGILARQEAGKLLKVGDSVLWRGGFGMFPEAVAVVEGIYKTSAENPKGECSDSLPSVPWAQVVGRAFVLDLEGGSWAYACQIRPRAVTPTELAYSNGDGDGGAE